MAPKDCLESRNCESKGMVGVPFDIIPEFPATSSRVRAQFRERGGLSNCYERGHV
ncbi:hypothetical protein FIBSPDRAFT_880529 [Athelia psychrophila]|uniref:Uncharacterized protein n=1 Tax=Athelia psychrophila TaxID=1759441 RepID=A0A167SRK5_9AGAM|nr:hypothetical protein FIBSPDRAFT_880529 [Fibularhizoctonia sp. CBS 109695]